MPVCDHNILSVCVYRSAFTHAAWSHVDRQGGYGFDVRANCPRAEVVVRWRDIFAKLPVPAWTLLYSDGAELEGVNASPSVGGRVFTFHNARHVPTITAHDMGLALCV